MGGMLDTAVRCVVQLAWSRLLLWVEEVHRPLEHDDRLESEAKAFIIE